MLKNILQYLENTAARMPDKLAFSDGERTLTHGELLSLSRRIGSYFSAKAHYREPVPLLLDLTPGIGVNFSVDIIGLPFSS